MEELEQKEFTDHVHGADSDSGLYAQVACPKCREPHFAKLSRIGWVLFTCRGALVSGHYPNWKHEGIASLRARQ